jgi:SagB-type dehydrogenase family enzyme
MEIIKLKPPQPLAKPRPLPIFDFQISGVLQIPKLAQRKLRPLDQVLNTRKSQREFKTPLTFQQLGDLLWHSLRVRECRLLTGNIMWQSKPSPSGGGCHPIQLLVLRAPVLINALLVYDSEHHIFGVREMPDSKFLRRCLGEVEKCLKIHNGTTLWFVADLARSGARYRNPESLAWRDSGALMATIGLVAESMALECCGLGFHDIPLLRRFLKLNQSVIGVGGCVVGGTMP